MNRLAFNKMFECAEQIVTEIEMQTSGCLEGHIADLDEEVEVYFTIDNERLFTYPLTDLVQLNKPLIQVVKIKKDLINIVEQYTKQFGLFYTVIENFYIYISDEPYRRRSDL